MAGGPNVSSFTISTLFISLPPGKVQQEHAVKPSRQISISGFSSSGVHEQARRPGENRIRPFCILVSNQPEQRGRAITTKIKCEHGIWLSAKTVFAHDGADANPCN